ncbi:hypothetical protein HYR69_04125 [Candidatus Sumerlaeota bacterium]|nr:hypothetical protein [Candidatus Sumerlaeota bacterium]
MTTPKRKSEKSFTLSCLKQLKRLVAKFKSDLLVIEDAHARGSRRCSRVRDLFDRVADIAAAEGMACRAVSRKALKQGFAAEGAKTQYEMAKLIVGDSRNWRINSRLTANAGCRRTRG